MTQFEAKLTCSHRRGSEPPWTLRKGWRGEPWRVLGSTKRHSCCTWCTGDRRGGGPIGGRKAKQSFSTENAWSVSAWRLCSVLMKKSPHCFNDLAEISLFTHKRCFSSSYLFGAWHQPALHLPVVIWCCSFLFIMIICSFFYRHTLCHRYAYFPWVHYLLGLSCQPPLSHKHPNLAELVWWNGPIPSIKHLCIISSHFSFTVTGLAHPCLRTDFHSAAKHWSVHWISSLCHPLLPGSIGLHSAHGSQTFVLSNTIFPVCLLVFPYFRCGSIVATVFSFWCLTHSHICI